MARRTPAPGLAAALLFGLAGLGLGSCSRTQPPEPHAGAELKVETGKQAKLDPDAALRCFVHGQFVGMQTPAQCAQKNGVATGALDVGLDQSGALAAGGGDTHLQSLAEVQNAESAANAEADVGGSGPGPGEGEPQANDEPPPRTAASATSGCLRFGRDGWRAAGQGLTLNACVRALFEGRCVVAGHELYGRWGAQTLRLAPGRVELSDDNHTFRFLAAQDADDCSLPSL